MRAVLLAGLCSLGYYCAASAASLPPQVEAAVQESRDACKPDKAVLEPGFVSTRDVNGDGVPDYVLDYAAFRCGDNASFFCGSAGCTKQVFASTSGGYVKVLDENVQVLTFQRVQGRPAMILGLHGSACGKAGSQPCGATLFWTGSKFARAR